MAKNYKLTYEVVYYPKVKDVSFHGIITRPVYIKTIYRRSVKDFKSSSFDVLSQQKYKRRIRNKAKALNEIVREETELMHFISENLKESTLANDLLPLYKLYSTDITEFFEEAFRAYLVLFFSDLKLDALHRTIAESRFAPLYENLCDLKDVLKSDIAANLFGNAIKQGQVYLPVYEFTLKFSGSWTNQLTVFRWHSGDTQRQFKDFLDKYYPSDAIQIFKSVDKLVNQILYR